MFTAFITIINGQLAIQMTMIKIMRTEEDPVTDMRLTLNTVGEVKKLNETSYAQCYGEIDCNDQ